MVWDLRTGIVDTIKKDQKLSDVYGDRIMQRRQGVEIMRPFMVYRLGPEAELFRWRNGPMERQVDFWIHDDPGDYTRIDHTIDDLKRVFDALINHDTFIEARHISSGPELEDPELKTILRVARFLFTTSQ